MRSLGAIVVGIGDYRYDRAQLPLLRFAAHDAAEIVNYLSTCWPKPDEAKIVRLANVEATREAIESAFAALGQEGPYDLQLIFLSGHGFVDTERAGLVIQPSASSSSLCLLDSANLDHLLASVSAQRTVLVLDCCYAEGITRRMSFFAGLGESDARLFIASSREQQLTWEDEHVGHGIFTGHLLDLLKTGSSNRLRGVRDRLDVDGELFPVLCDQVPLYVLEHKQQRQEPVKGGVSIRPIRLPVARAARRIRERTAFGTAVRRLRQIGLGIAFTASVFLLFAYVLLYYAEADRDGNIRVYHGTKWLTPIFQFLPTLRVDTGISSKDLSNDPTSRYGVQTGAASGIWTHMTPRGYRAWYESIRPSLNAEAIERYDVLLSAGGKPLVYRLDDQSLPPEIALAAWALLDGADSGQLDRLFEHVLGADRVANLNEPFSMGDLDFNVMDLTQSQLARFADALRFAAAIDPDRTFLPYLGFLKANQIWLAHSLRIPPHGDQGFQPNVIADSSAT